MCRRQSSFLLVVHLVNQACVRFFCPFILILSDINCSGFFFKSFHKLRGKLLFSDDTMLLRRMCNLLKHQWFSVPPYVREKGRQPFIFRRQVTEDAVLKGDALLLQVQCLGTGFSQGFLQICNLWEHCQQLHVKDSNGNFCPLGPQRKHLSPVLGRMFDPTEEKTV